MRSRALVLAAILLLVSSAVRAIVADRQVIIRRLTLTGGQMVSATDQRRLIQEIKSREYDSNDLNEIAERVRFAFQKLGYFKVSVQAPSVTALQPDGSRQIVDVNVTVSEGERYRLKDIRFKASTLFPAAQLRAQFKISDGEIFDRERIANGLDELRSLYCTRGYLDFSAVPETTIDETLHTVSLDVDLDEGSEFRAGKLLVLGEESEPGAKEKLLNAWKPYEGRVFDCGLLQHFLRDLHARPDVTPERIFKTSQNPATQVVDVEITLVKPPIF